MRLVEHVVVLLGGSVEAEEVGRLHSNSVHAERAAEDTDWDACSGAIVGRLGL